MKAAIIAGCVVLSMQCAAPRAHAADLRLKPCESGAPYCYAITITGKIEKGDGFAFRNLIKGKEHSHVTVGLNSSGGNFEAGLAIAEAVYYSQFKTLVGDDWRCTSMCAVIWLAGSTRYYHAKAKIGFHGVSTSWLDNNGKTDENRAPVPYNGGNALIGAFYNLIGLKSEAILALTDANHDDTYWLSAERAARLGIVVSEWKQ
jgi:hypothetical protein